jgi:hypothetical protein
VSKTRTFTALLLIVAASLAIAGGRASAAGQGATRCTTSAANSGTAAFMAFGDGTLYIKTASGTTSLDDGGSLLADCARTAGIRPVVRFYARSLSTTGAIHVEVLTKRGSVVLDGGYVTAGATLAPVQAASIPWDRNGSGAADLQVRLTAVGGSFEIGDVYVDPYMQK